jgi:uncharacterized protein (TIGR00251 family)
VLSNNESFELDVRVIPNASRDVIVGWHAGALKIKVATQPESGKANKAVCSLLAKQLQLQKRSVCVVSGATSQTKRLQITGISEAAVRARLP